MSAQGLGSRGSVLEIFYDELQRVLDRQERRRESDRARVTRLFGFLAVVVAVVSGALPDSEADRIPIFVGLGLALVPLILISVARGRREDVDLEGRWEQRDEKDADEMRRAIIDERFSASKKNAERLRRSDRLLTWAEVATAAIVFYFFVLFILADDSAIRVGLLV